VKGKCATEISAIVRLIGFYVLRELRMPAYSFSHPMNSERQDAVNQIAREMEDEAERVAAARQLRDAEELLMLAQEYNWGDGMALPLALADHPCCDLGLSLHLFELAEGITWLTGQGEWSSQQEWADFCEELARRIQAGVYVRGTTAFRSSLTAIQRHKAVKAGVPEIFLNPVDPLN
jgi:hypothetical protein